MNEKLAAAWDRLRYFCAEQTINFYVGMALSVLLILNLKTIVSLSVRLAICPVATPLIYLLLRMLFQRPKEMFRDKSALNGALATTIGSLWAVFLTLI